MQWITLVCMSTLPLSFCTLYNAIYFIGYPDCRPEYIAAYEKMAQLATKSGVQGETLVRILTPLIHMTKFQIIETGLSLGVEYP